MPRNLFAELSRSGAIEQARRRRWLRDRFALIGITVVGGATLLAFVAAIDFALAAWLG